MIKVPPGKQTKNREMKYIYLIRCVVVFTLIQGSILSLPELYAADSEHFEIGEVSSKKSEQLFIEIAIGLLNGETRFVSLDNMIRILKDYEIVELQSEDIEPAKEIILKEVAFRMLKQHYLPRIGDKIKVYKSQKEFLRETGIRPAKTDRPGTVISLPLEIATIKDCQQLKTIHWRNLVAQISTVIEKLWLKRIGYEGQPPGNAAEERVLLEAVGLLRRKYIQGEDIAGRLKAASPAGHMVKAAEERIEQWLKEESIHKDDIPVLTELVIQYIIHSNPRKASYISRELKALRDISDLKAALRHRIISTAENIKSYNPADYGVLAMLQSLLNEISSRFSFFSNNKTDYPANINFKESRHSA